VHGAALTVVLALLVGVLAQSAARHLRIPGIVVLLVAGAALGPEALGWVRPGTLGEGLFSIVDLAVAVILFEGGLNLQISRLRREQAPIRRLVTVGALVTMLGGTLAAYTLMGWDWMTSLLFGSLVVVTGPTVVGPLVEEARLRPRVGTVLEAEGVLIDPIGAILAVLVLELALAPDSLAGGAGVLFLRLSFGTLLGAAAGYGLAQLLLRRRIVPEGHENVLVLASVLVIFEGGDAIVSHSGILAVTVAGVVMGNVPTRVDRDLREFKDQLSVMLIGLLFVLLAADVSLDDVRALGWHGVAVLAALVLVVRPLDVLACTLGSGLSARERALLAWIAPRGIVAAAIASITAAELGARDLPGGDELRALVFLVIAGTVVLAGLTGPAVAGLLGQRLPGRDRVAILGAQGLGMLLGRELRAAGAGVVFLDANPGNCRQAEEEGFQVVYGDALQERALQRAHFESVGSAVGVTPNQLLNSSFVQRARERFRVPRGYVSTRRPERGLAQELLDREQAFVLFDGPHDVERWDVRFRHDTAEVEPWVRGEAPAPERGEAKREKGREPGEAKAVEEKGPAEKQEKPRPRTDDCFVLLCVRRGARVQPMHADLALQPGDRVSVAVFTDERDAAHAELRCLGLEPAPPEEDAEQADA